jgi:ABC-type Fe3+-hydroxamate transport system substrate-binding protein
MLFVGRRADAPQRIIRPGGTTEMLFALGAGRQLAGVGNYDRFPPDVERLPRVGGLIDPNVERILSLKPDLVIVYDTQTDLKRQLERAKIPMFHYLHRGLPDITATMRGLGERVGAKAAADAAATRIEQQLDAIRTRGRAGLVRTLLVSGASRVRCAMSTPAPATASRTTSSELAGGRTLGDLPQSVDMSSEILDAGAGGRPQPTTASRQPDRLSLERLVWNALASVPP